MKPQTPQKAIRKPAKPSQNAKPKGVAKPSQSTKPKAKLTKPGQDAEPKVIAKPKPSKPKPGKPQAIPKHQPIPKPKKVQPVSKAHPVQDALKAAQAKIAKLEAENAELKARLDKLTRKPLKIAGWLVVLRKAGGGNCKYWYAGKSIGGKMKWIYLGKMLKIREAKVKIEDKAKKFLTRKSKRG